MPSNFPSVPSHGLVVGTRGSLGRNSPLPILRQWHPRALHCLRAYQLPKHWGVPSLATPPQCPCAVLAPRAPFRRSPVPSTLPPWHSAPRSRISGSPVPTTYPGPPWALGLPRPTSPVPGVPTQRYAPFVATLPTRQQGSCTPPKRDRAYTPTNSKTTSILSI